MYVLACRGQSIVSNDNPQLLLLLSFWESFSLNLKLAVWSRMAIQLTATIFLLFPPQLWGKRGALPCLAYMWVQQIWTKVFIFAQRTYYLLNDIPSTGIEVFCCTVSSNLSEFMYLYKNILLCVMNPFYILFSSFKNLPFYWVIRFSVF